jgi:hypothetical protein
MTSENSGELLPLWHDSSESAHLQSCHNVYCGALMRFQYRTTYD